MPRLPLQGVRVLDHGIVLAGPTCAVALADLGAEVIRIEPFLRFPTATRGMQPHPSRSLPLTALNGYPDYDPGDDPWNRMGTFNGINRNKLSLTLELADPEALAIYHRLIKLSDVVVENFAGGVMTRLGMGYEALRAINPGIIMISLSGFGATGPYGQYVSFGSNVDAITSHTLLRGYPGEEPSEASSMVWPDNVGGATGAFAVLTALMHRARTGQGQHIDMSQVETFATHMGDAFMEWSLTGRLPQQMGDRHAFWAPHGVYPCKGDDTWIAIAVEDDAQFAALCALMERPGLASDARFASAPARKADEDALDAEVSAWTAQHDYLALTERLQSAGVPAGAVMGPKEQYEDAHLAERGFFRELTHPSTGTHRYPGVQWRLSRTPVDVRWPGPKLGEHNRPLLEGLMGLSVADVDGMAERKLIGDAYPPDVIVS
ncbi:MAG: CoA transferase [Chloroflexi bacterium]|nr:CoA transferase [Chloroflexota bacterium]